MEIINDGLSNLLVACIYSIVELSLSFNFFSATASGMSVS